MSRRCPLLLALLAAAVLPAVARSAAALPPMPALGPQDRVLVIAPHPDDESLCCAGLLQQARARGASAGIVWITAGDGFEFDAMVLEHTFWPGRSGMRRLGTRRLEEAHAAADALGVPRASQFVLGYPDRGIQALLDGYRIRAYRSTYTGARAVLYAGTVSPGASYTGANLERDLDAVIERFHPTLVLAAAPEDTHPDHAASGALTRRLLERRGELGELWYWIVHAPGWPQPRKLDQDLPLLPPPAAAARHWQSLALAPAQRAGKLAALRDHRSQMHLMARFMESFDRANEIFTPAR